MEAYGLHAVNTLYHYSGAGMGQERRGGARIPRMTTTMPDTSTPHDGTPYTGRSIPRFEDDRLLRGGGTFIADMTLPEMAHAAIVRSPHAHARIERIDASEALAMPGVLAIITADDVEDGAVLESIGRPGLTINRGGAHPILALGRALYAGQPVAAVAAETAAQAADAAARVEVVYEPLEAINDLQRAADGGYPTLHPAIGSNVGAWQRTGGGDVDGAFAAADRVVAASFVIPRLAPMPMEGRGCIAEFDADGDLTFRSSNQSPHDTQHHIEEAITLPGHVRVITPDVGGGFGHKHHVYPEEVAAIVLAMRLNRPVKWVEERSENIHSSHARGLQAHVEAAVTSEGIVLAIRARFLSDLGAYWISGAFTSPDNAAKRFAGPYHIPTYDGEQVCLMTNRPPITSYRGAGQPEATFCMERMLDLVGEELGIDPVELRRRNLIPPDRFPYTTMSGTPYVDGDYEPVLDRALEVAGYGDLLARRDRERAEGRTVGLGIALSTKGSGGTGGDAARSSAAAVEVGADGHVRLTTDISPHGQGNATTFMQITADALGVTPDDVSVLHGDSAGIEPFGPGAGTYASRGLVIGGHAVHQTALQARDRLLDAASHLLETPLDDVTLEGGAAVSRSDPSRSVPLGRLAGMAGSADGGFRHYSTYTLPPGSFAFAAHIAYVEIDPDSGGVSVRDFVAVHDVGNLINPVIVEGQIHGGVAQGFGEAMCEAVSYADDGRPREWSFMDYAMPLAEDLPHMVVETHATEARNGAMGVRGIGEMPSCASPAALANAVHDALRQVGAPMVDIPFTAERVWQSVRQARGPGGLQSARGGNTIGA